MPIRGQPVLTSSAFHHYFVFETREGRGCLSYVAQADLKEPCLSLPSS